MMALEDMNWDDFMIGGVVALGAFFGIRQVIRHRRNQIITSNLMKTYLAERARYGSATGPDGMTTGVYFPPFGQWLKERKVELAGAPHAGRMYESEITAQGWML